MALVKKAVFIASRFAEFAELREAIKRRITDYTVVQLSAVDLNDGNVSHRPPLQECLGYVRRSEFLILLLGDGYGEPAPGKKKSITHLEYEEAIREGSNTRVLVFCIGHSYRDRSISYSNDNEQLALLQRQVHDNHTIGFFDPSTPVDVISREIFERLRDALFEMSFGVLAEHPGDEFGADFVFDSDDSIVSESEITSLEDRGARARGTSLSDDSAEFSDTLAAVTRPAAVVAQEQREEAQRAIELGQLSVAVQHLRRALDARPLDVLSNYWLAQIYVAMGDKKKAVEAVEYAERAARIAEYDNAPFRAAASYITAARACNILEKNTEAMAYARRAAEITETYSRCHIELARQHAIAGRPQEMIGSLDRAFRLFPRSLQAVFADVAFRPYRGQVAEFLSGLKGDLQQRVQGLLDAETALCELDARPVPAAIPPKLSVRQLTDHGKNSVSRQLGIVRDLYAKADHLAAELAPAAAVPPPRHNVRFPFQHAGALEVVRWLVQDGEVIGPDKAILEYRFQGSGQIRVWKHHGRDSVRLFARGCAAGGLVSSDSPLLYATVPAGWLPPAKTEAQQNVEKLESVRRILSDAATEKAVAESLVTAAGAAPARQPYKLRLILTAALATLALVSWFWHLGILFFLSFIGAAAVAFSWSAEWRRFRDNLQSAKKRLTIADERHREAIAAFEPLDASIRALGEQRSRAAETARMAIEKFERTISRAQSIYLPFKSLFAANVGDTVRLREPQLVQFRNASRREVVLNDDFPDWLVLATADSSHGRLLSVVELDDARMVLSRRAAYAGGGRKAAGSPVESD